MVPGDILSFFEYYPSMAILWQMSCNTQLRKLVRPIFVFHFMGIFYIRKQELRCSCLVCTMIKPFTHIHTHSYTLTNTHTPDIRTMQHESCPLDKFKGQSCVEIKFCFQVLKTDTQSEQEKKRFFIRWLNNFGDFY